MRYSSSRVQCQPGDVSSDLIGGVGSGQSDGGVRHGLELHAGLVVEPLEHRLGDLARSIYKMANMLIIYIYH